MHSNGEHQAAHEFLRTAAIVPFTVTSHEVIPGSDEGEFALRLELSFADDESPEEDRADVVEWGALGFLFALGVLSFADARPRGFSEAEFNPNDEFRLADFVAALTFRNGELHLDTDYVRGRRDHPLAGHRRDRNARSRQGSAQLDEPSQGRQAGARCAVMRSV